MSTIQINSQHRGNLDLADIQNIKTNAKEGDTVKFGSVFGKEYSVTKSNDGEISLKQKENRSFFNRFFSKTDSSKNSDLKLNLMNQQLHKKENNGNVKVLTLTYNQANQKMPAETKNYFQNLIQKGDYDVVLFAEQESKLLANDLELDGMNLLSQNKMKVMTKGLSEGVSYTSMSVFAKDGVDINVKNESEYRHGIGGRNMEFFMGITGNKGGVKTALEINGQPLNVISAHLDSNKEVKREFEGNKLMEGINPNEEVLITGDLNEREKRVAEGSDVLYDPIAHDDTHLAKHGFKFKPLDSHTYMQLDKHTGNIKQKEGRDRPDFGELDNTGLTNKTGNLQNHQTSVITDGFENVSDHKPVQSTFEVRSFSQKLIENAFTQNANDFKNDAAYLKPGTNPANATFDDVTSANQARLGLENLNPNEQAFVKENFASFIIGKDAIFSQLTSGFMEEMGQLHASDLAKNPTHLQAQQIALSEKYEQLSDKVNAEFNKQFVANL
ncbi:VPA0450 family T3SS effector inositol phosphatase [Vibrio parahaemolyticus]|nr:VPA0450 family T3SS effector inositol phosphatase [Vibrio parahaemolyticus]HCH3863362.1 VPA0450 family T3SS effector inositol phosphatase [Vibrio parahaemolyticus]HCH4308350.1 VPA0450 family T3SS effector inositol phosphatase [Vibrio parahaemolyticus]HCH4312687.1 VPA0450 family T3SS effector inositol phosphatase [Vibrio parahaemolyticus]